MPQRQIETMQNPLQMQTQRYLGEVTANCLSFTWEWCCDCSGLPTCQSPYCPALTFLSTSAPLHRLVMPHTSSAKQPFLLWFTAGWDQISTTQTTVLLCCWLQIYFLIISVFHLTRTLTFFFPTPNTITRERSHTLSKQSDFRRTLQETLSVE